MSYDTTCEWDEDTFIHQIEDEYAGESILRNEHDIVLSRLNSGIAYEYFSPDQLA